MSLARGLEEVGVQTSCKSIVEFDVQGIEQYDFIAIGSPTHVLKTSKTMKAFLREVATFDLKGKLGFGFDTRNDSKMNKRFLLVLENSAARVIEGWMKRRKMKIVRSRESANVQGREGPLDQGVNEEFLEIGRELGQRLGKSEGKTVKSLST
jgi:multimeric flavodoxin WrbA